MALIGCPQCETQVSEFAKKCPSCGRAFPGAVGPVRRSQQPTGDLDLVAAKVRQLNAGGTTGRTQPRTTAAPRRRRLAGAA